MLKLKFKSEKDLERAAEWLTAPDGSETLVVRVEGLVLTVKNRQKALRELAKLDDLSFEEDCVKKFCPCCGKLLIQNGENFAVTGLHRKFSGKTQTRILNSLSRRKTFKREHLQKLIIPMLESGEMRYPSVNRATSALISEWRRRGFISDEK